MNNHSRVLGLSWSEAALAHEGRLLVAEHPRYRRALELGRRQFPVNLRAGSGLNKFNDNVEFMTIFIDYILLLAFCFALTSGLFLVFKGIKLI